MNQLSHLPFPPAPPPQPEPAVGLIDFGRLLHPVLRRKWGILGFAFAVSLATAMVVLSMEPVYRASASIVLENQEANVVSVEKVYTLGSGDYEYSNTQYEILRSRDLAERVVRRLRLHQHPVFLPEDEPEREHERVSWLDLHLKRLLGAGKQEPPAAPLTPEEREERAIQAVSDAVAAGLEVSPVEYSYMVHLGFESTDSRLAAQIVNALAQEFIDGNLQSRLAGTLQATGWLSERLEDLKQNLRESERALQAFREQEGLVSVDGVTSLGGNELAALSQRLEDARKARIEAQNIMENVRGLGDASTDELMTVPAVLEHQLIRDMKKTQSEAERKVAELGKRYGHRHPKMIAAESELAAANAELQREVRKVVSGISREYQIARRNEQQLQATWEASKSELQEFNRVEFQLQDLQREVDTNRQLYEIFLSRIKSVSETGGFEKPHARIVDRAVVPERPVKPDKRRSVTLAFVLGILLGCGIAIVLDMLDNTVKTPDEVQEKLGVPLLGSLPKMKPDRQGEFEQYWQKPRGLFAESMRTIRTGVVLSGLDEPAKIIVVTSTLPGEGKSTIAINLGAALAQMEKTLVIGADLRCPSLAGKCGIPPNHPGLSQYVAGSAELEACLAPVEALGLHVMPAGVIPPNPLEMLSSRRFAAALQTLRGRFERIVIDSSPVQAVSDALVLASHADSVIYVVKADSTPATEVQKGIARIVASNEPLTGVVLNQFDARAAGRYYGYGDYYQSDEPMPA
jgi:succinoglycan biosynthesis transport protein ExoP